MNTEERKSLLLYLARRLRECQRELVACRATLFILRQHFPGVDATLENALQSEEIRMQVDSRFEGLEELIQTDDTKSQEKAVAVLLQKLELPGEAN